MPDNMLHGRERNESLIGTYCGDYGIDGDVYPCVHFDPRKVAR